MPVLIRFVHAQNRYGKSQTHEFDLSIRVGFANPGKTTIYSANGNNSCVAAWVEPNVFPLITGSGNDQNSTGIEVCKIPLHLATDASGVQAGRVVPILAGTTDGKIYYLRPSIDALLNGSKHLRNGAAVVIVQSPGDVKPNTGRCAAQSLVVALNGGNNGGRLCAMSSAIFVPSQHSTVAQLHVGALHLWRLG